MPCALDTGAIEVANYIETLNFEVHISQICCKARQSMYALHILTAHGLKGPKLVDVARATTVARLLYASSAWWGFARQQCKNRLQSIISTMIQRGVHLLTYNII